MTDTPIVLSAYNTSRFQISFDVTQWAAGYVLSTAAWRMQIRPTAESQLVSLEMSTANGGASFAANVVVFQSSESSVQTLSGQYDWDFGFTPVGGDFVRCGGGTITINQGVTR